MVFALLYNGLPDSIKVTQMSDSLALEKHHMFSKIELYQSPICICSVSEFTASIRIPAYCK